LKRLSIKPSRTRYSPSVRKISAKRKEGHYEAVAQASQVP
jgi:hypothetical protein